MSFYSITNNLEDCPAIDQIVQILYEHNIVTSICVGPMQKEKGIKWSVTCMNFQENAEFEKPFAAKDFYHGLQIAYLECRLRGWLQEKRIVKPINNIVVGR